MTRLQIIVIFVLILLAVEILLKLFGIINLSSNEIFGYAFIIYGISSVSISFGKNHKGVLFIGSLIFSIGFILITISNFEILNTNSIVFSSVFFCIATGFLILFLDEPQNRVFIFLSSVFFIIAFAAAIYSGAFETAKFVESIKSITVKFWPLEVVALAGTALFGYLNRD